MTVLAALAFALAARADVISEIAANAKCIQVEFLLEQYGTGALPTAEELLREALGIDPRSRARQMLVEVVRLERAHGMPVSAATEAALLAAESADPTPIQQAPARTPSRAQQRLSGAAAVAAKGEGVGGANSAGLALPGGDGSPLTRAAALVQQAIDLQTKDADSYSATPRVIELYRAALALLPDLRVAHPDFIGSVLDNLGVALRAVDRVPEAIVEQRRAIEVNPNEPRHRMNFAGTLFMSGNMAEAAEQCRHALRLDPMYAKALNILNAIEPIKEPDDERLALLMRHAAATDKLTTEERAITHFDLYKALDKFKQYDEAWGHLELGNTLALEAMQAQGPLPADGEMRAAYRRVAAAFDERTLAALIAKAEAARAAEAGAGGTGTDSSVALAGASGSGNATAVRSMAVGPIFVVGAYRSGSTLAESILASHSLVHGAGENTALGATLGAFQVRLAEAKGAVYPEGFVGLALSGRDPLLFERIGEEYARTMRESPAVASAGKPRWVDKNLGNVRNVGPIVVAMPNALVIHTARSPVATCFSMFTQHFTQGSAVGRYFTCTQDALAAHYAALHEMMRHWDRVLPAGRMLTVQYEEMVVSQEAVSKRIVDFAGLEWEEACLHFHKQERSVATASLAQVRKPMYNSSLDSWKRYAPKLKPLIDQLATEVPETPWRTARWPDQPTPEEWAAMLADGSSKAQAGGAAEPLAAGGP